MAKRLTSMVLAACCLVWCAVAVAQPPAPGPGDSPYFMPNPGGPENGYVPPVVPCCNPPVMVANETNFQAPTVQIGFDYLIRWVSQQKSTPLITRGPSSDPVPAALGQPGTRVAVSTFDPDLMQQGGRINLGVGTDGSSDWSVLASGFWLGENKASQQVSSAGEQGSSVLARPFFNVVAGLQDADPAAFPRIASGNIAIESSRNIYGFDLAFRYLYNDDSGGRTVLLFGPSYLGLEESLRIQVNSTDLPGLGVPGNAYFLREEFNGRNYFYGSQFGFDYEYRVGPVFVKTIAKLSVGAVDQVVSRNPFIRITEPNGIVTASSDRALYISPANTGTFSRVKFGLMPEATLRFGIDLNQHVQLAVGYSILYLDTVVRPGDQIDRNVIVQPVGTSATFVSRGSPPTFRTNDFMAQGLDLILRLSF